MADKQIGLREVRELAPNTEVWDAAVPGFGARRRAGAAVSYVLMYRTLDGRQRRFTIGRHGAPWTPDTARKEARRLLGEVVRGNDPAADKQARRDAMTVAELCDAYLVDAGAGRLLTRAKKPKKASTLLSDRCRVEAHVKPLLGRLPVAAVTSLDIERFMNAVAEGETARKGKTNNPVRGGMGTASRTVGLLGAVFAYAVRNRMRPDNPVRGVVRPADGKLERRLSDLEYAALGTALRRAADENVWPPAVAAVRFLALTGWRSGEALKLRWEEIDLATRTARLADTKTGRSMRPLSNAACDVLVKLDRLGDLVFPPSRSGRNMAASFGWLWERIARLGGLPDDVTPHTLRHSFSSLAADLGYSELTIAAVVGHKKATVTSRYVHSADSVLLAAADAVATETAVRMGEARAAGKVVNLRAG